MLGLALGGNVRVGMEDDPLGDGKGNWSNLSAVEFVTRVAQIQERELATTSDVRERLLR